MLVYHLFSVKSHSKAMSTTAPTTDGIRTKSENLDTHKPTTEYPAQEPTNPANTLARIPMLSPFLVKKPAIQPIQLPTSKDKINPT